MVIDVKGNEGWGEEIRLRFKILFFGPIRLHQGKEIRRLRRLRAGALVGLETIFAVRIIK